MTHQRVQEVINAYDEQLGYKKHYERCMREFDRAPPKEDLPYSGIDKHEVLKSEECTELKYKFDNESFKLEDPEFNIEIFNKIISPTLDDRISRIFQSEYMPLWYRWHKHDQNINPDPAPSWHCIAGPTVQLMMFVYLTSTDLCGGNITFLSRTVTNDLKELGHIFCPLKDRQSELHSLIGTYDEIKIPVGEGECLLFDSFNIAHKIIWPVREPCYMVQFCLIPAHRPWYVEVSKRNVPRESTSWPRIT